MTLLFALACAPESTLHRTNDVEPVIEGVGDVSGRVCDPTGYTWLKGATVYANLYDADGWLIDVKTTTTDESGYWALRELPTGSVHDIRIQKGTSVVEEHQVEVRSGKVVKLDEPACLDPSTLDIAVVSGNYDDFDRVLDHMGVTTYDIIDGLDEGVLSSFLLNPEEMAEYDLIFFNGGILEADVIYTAESDGVDVAQVHTNIREFVENGGHVYASDWSYDVVTQVWPDRIDFLGADTKPDAAQLGATQQVNAAISNYALAQFMEDEDQYVPITYDLPVWPPIVAVGGTTSVHLTADVEYREAGVVNYQAGSPLLVSFNGGGGRVVFSSFRLVANDNEDVIKVMKYVMFAL
ncbi:MAG: carboxypeptidase regulatory-like domain-containing protein [Proteobacteria bacterium]|nr:carboxypeptidase regulatory-like domain-containing protein [Pseudomonadota bacterium]